MNWKLPNQLTVGRILLAGVFFVLLGLYRHGAPEGPMLLNAAFAIYIVAGITDVLDGYLARRMKLTSAFGRIVDPFVDKVLVVGAFAMLAANNFILPSSAPRFEQQWSWVTGAMASAVQGWMVVVIMAREFVVSAVRGYSESRGVTFPATPAGKIKMFIQSVAICMVLFQLANYPQSEQWAAAKVVLVWLAVGATVISALAYVGKARKVLLGDV
jgi:phosphatidylglycerophosphate synthase